MSDKNNMPFYKGRYEPMFGHNTKQWYGYDTETSEICDPPTDVLEKVNACDGFEAQEKFFQKILDENPDWLYDDGYRYDGDMEV